jgi:chromatin assembly factor 1 subunit A
VINEKLGKRALADDTGKITQPTRDFLVPSMPTSTLEANGPSADTNALKRKAPAAPPKSTFPDALLPQLLLGIRRCKTASLNVLVDSLYQELKATKVKKYAIETKVKEVAEKRWNGEAQKIWVVRADPVEAAVVPMVQ